MTPEDALALLLSKLDACKIPYMIAGSFASNMHGLPRATQDADIVIEADRASLERFLESLGQDFYKSEEAAREALLRRQIFNVIHLETGFKIDLIIRKSRPFSETEFSRRQSAFYLGTTRWFATAEDTILVKLEWSKQGESERQFNDALNVAKVQRHNLDRSYLRKWASELDLSDLVDQLLHKIDRGEQG